MFAWKKLTIGLLNPPRPPIWPACHPHHSALYAAATTAGNAGEQHAAVAEAGA